MRRRNLALAARALGYSVADGGLGPRPHRPHRLRLHHLASAATETTRQLACEQKIHRALGGGRLAQISVSTAQFCTCGRTGRCYGEMLDTLFFFTLRASLGKLFYQKILIFLKKN